MNLILSYWWVIIPVLLLIFYKLLFRLFGIIIIPEDKIGLVTKKFVLFGANKELPAGRIIAIDGEAGFQAQPLAPGIYFWKWIWQYEITQQAFTVIPEGKIGLLVAKDGKELETGYILARKVECDSFQNAEAFLRNGGRKGRQSAIITAGTYRINTFLFDVMTYDMTLVNENMVGIVTTLDGKPCR
jgi:uncharacterized membrane protein YqiK